MAKSSKGMSPDLICDILARLPVKSLKRFTSLSKTFHSEIKSPLFAKLHLLKQSAKPSNKFIIHSHGMLSIADMDSRDSVELYNFHHKFQLRGSCNGLVCLAHGHEPRILLWNIAIDEFRYIDSASSDFASARFVYGFGYDAINDDYKLLRFTRSRGSPAEITVLETWIYSLRMNSWRRISVDFSFKLCWEMNGVFVSNALHWMGFTVSNLSRKSIIAFDLHNETFQEVPLPDELDMICHIGVLEGCLCGLKSSNSSGEIIRKRAKKDYTLDVWVMKDYMEKESWTRFRTFSYCTTYLDDDRIFSRLKSGQQFLLRNSPNVNIQGMLCEAKCHDFRLENYVETLVSANDYSPAPPAEALQCPAPPTGVLQLLKGASNNERGISESDSPLCAFRFMKRRKMEFRNVSYPWYLLGSI